MKKKSDMRCITYVGPYQWKVTVRRKGFPSAIKTFETYEAAISWRDETERKMFRGDFRDEGVARTIPLRDLLDRYAREVVPKITSTEKYASQLRSRLRVIARHPIADVPLAKLGAAHLRAYRDQRLTEGRKRKTIKDELAKSGESLRTLCTRSAQGRKFAQTSAIGA